MADAQTRYTRQTENRFAYRQQGTLRNMITLTHLAESYAHTHGGVWPDGSAYFDLPEGTVRWPWRLRSTNDDGTGILSLSADPDALQAVVDALRMAESEDSDEDELD